MPELEAGPQRRPPTTGTPNVPVPENIFAGQSQALQHLGSNIQRMGWNIGQAARRSEYENYIDEYETGQIDYFNFIAEKESARAEDTDYANHGVRFNKERKSFAEDYLNSVKNSRAKKRLAAYFERHGLQKEINVSNNARSLMIQQIDARQPALQKININEYLNEGQVGPRKKIRAAYIKDLKEHFIKGYASQEWVDEQLRQRSIGLGKEAIKRDPALALDLLEGGDVDVLMSREDKELLTPDDIDGLRQDARREISFRKIQGNKAEIEAKAKYSEQVWDIARTGDVNGVEDLIDTFFPNQVLFADGASVADFKKELASGAHLTANRLSKGKSSPYTTRQDEPAYYEISTRLLNDPSSVSDQEIDAGVPHRWTTADREKLRKDKKTTENAAFQEFPAKQYLDSFDNLVFEEASESLKGMIFYTMGKRALMDFAVDSPDATPKQWAEEYSEIIEPFLADWTKWFFRRNWDRLTEELQETSGKATNVKKSPYEEWPDAYQENGVWYVKKDGKRYRIQD